MVRKAQQARQDAQGKADEKKSQASKIAVWKEWRSDRRRMKTCTMKRSKIITIAPKMHVKLTIKYYANIQAYECLFELRRWSKFLGILGPERIRKVELGGIVNDQEKVAPFTAAMCKYMGERFPNVNTKALNTQLQNFYLSTIKQNEQNGKS